MRRRAWSSVTRQFTFFNLHFSICNSPIGRCLFPIVTLLLFSATFALSAAAGEPRQLTRDGLLKRDPVFWPGGKEIIYTVEAETARMRLMRLTLADGRSKQFHKSRDMSDRELAVAADGAVYAYNVVSGLSSKIIVEDNRSGKKQTVPSIGLANWVNWPTLSPDGKTVVYTEGAGPILAYDVAKGGGKKTVKQLTTRGAKYTDYWPKFSPDGKQIVFASRRDNDFEIYLMNADGSNQQRLTDSPGIDAHPVFSPDGRRIAFTSNRDGNYEIYVMNADGKNVRRVTNNSERDDHPCWHPSGKQLVMVSERSGRFDLYLVDVPD
ncbi:MAG: PD40 domain-containing protein [Planctomycetes bacterium]|nr:PD40 domain-containing protein [Planctomycetota bacterium]